MVIHKKNGIVTFLAFFIFLSLGVWHTCVAAPTIAPVTVVTTPATDMTPKFVFSSTEAGTIVYGGSCASTTTAAVSGTNTIIFHLYIANTNRDCATSFNGLPPGTYTDCTIAVKNVNGELSNMLSVNPFVITDDDRTPPALTFSDNVAQGPVAFDRISVAWDDATIKKWTYRPDRNCAIDAASYTFTDADSMDQSTGERNGSYICVYAEDASGHKMTMVSAHAIIITQDTTPPNLTFTDDVEQGPVMSDNVVAAWDDATVKKWMYNGDSHCPADGANYTRPDTESMHQTTEEHNGSFICLYGQDAAGNTATKASAYPINIDRTKPVLTQVTAVPSPTTDSTPDYTFHTTEAGAITYTGACTSATTTATQGNNTITFATLAPGTYTNCTITVTDRAGNAATALVVREFIIRKQHPVYRFFSQEYHTHFYTISEAEKDYIIASYAPSVWNYEGIAYQAMNVPDADVTQPLYRFWSQTNRKHFYTADAYEKEHLINGAYPEAQFVYEGIAWYTNVSQTTATRPLYRFYSPVYRAHFYTISEEERDVVIERYAPIIWTYEGVAWYALK